MLGSPVSFARRLLAWYDRSRRDLPWRLNPSSGQSLDPYHVLVSETMLQQTQVATVVPFFLRFIKRFPDFQALAAADEQEVLRLWQGLGYYSRARNLQAAARTVVTEYGGRLPQDPSELLKLPGVGRYTAGAVASIAFGRRAPIVDGNVARVLCRIDKIETDPREPHTIEILWRRAEEILPRKRTGDFNSALMELGATVCTPRSPQCLICPVRKHCEAAAAGIQERIPAPRKARPTPLHRRTIVCIRRDGQWLIEQRPPRGRWAGMWQFVTVTPDETSGIARISLPVRATEPVAIGSVRHALTHRRYHFEVLVCESRGGEPPGAVRTGGRAARLSSEVVKQPPRAWTTLEGLSAYPLPRPHLKVRDMLRGL